MYSLKGLSTSKEYELNEYKMQYKHKLIIEFH